VCLSALCPSPVGLCCRVLVAACEGVADNPILFLWPFRAMSLPWLLGQCKLVPFGLTPGTKHQRGVQGECKPKRFPPVQIRTGPSTEAKFGLRTFRIHTEVCWKLRVTFFASRRVRLVRAFGSFQLIRFRVKVKPPRGTALLSVLTFLWTPDPSKPPKDLPNNCSQKWIFPAACCEVVCVKAVCFRVVCFKVVSFEAVCFKATSANFM
jgi:hypothetical protein